MRGINSLGDCDRCIKTFLATLKTLNTSDRGYDKKVAPMVPPMTIMMEGGLKNQVHSPPITIAAKTKPNDTILPISVVMSTDSLQ
jgi:hypothetical protein